MYIYPVYLSYRLSYFFILLLCCIAGNESCPQPQTSEHLAAIEIMRLRHIIILQNKIDIIKESQAQEQYQDIVRFVQGQHIVFVLSIVLCVKLEMAVIIGYFLLWNVLGNVFYVWFISLWQQICKWMINSFNTRIAHTYIIWLLESLLLPVCNKAT